MSALHDKNKYRPTTVLRTSFDLGATDMMVLYDRLGNAEFITQILNNSSYQNFSTFEK